MSFPVQSVCMGRYCTGIPAELPLNDWTGPEKIRKKALTFSA